MITPIEDREITRVNYMFGRRWLHYNCILWITAHGERMLAPEYGEVTLEQYGSVEQMSITHRMNLWSYTWDDKTHYFYNDTNDYDTARAEAIAYIGEREGF